MMISYMHDNGRAQGPGRPGPLPQQDPEGRGRKQQHETAKLQHIQLIHIHE